jgi:hypothetical protein
MKIIRNKRNRKGILVILVAGVLSTALANLAQADPGADNPGLPGRVSELESANTDSQARIEALESFVRLLHRQSAAVLEIDDGGGSSGVSTELEFTMIFCSGDDSGGGNACPLGAPDLTVILSESDVGTITTFSAASDPDFDAIAGLLTNGDSDFIEIRRSLVGSPGAGASSGPEIAFIRDFLAPGAIDLSGYSISRISLAVDYLNIFSDGSQTQTTYSIRGRLFFELGE